MSVAALQAPVLDHGPRRQTEPMSLGCLFSHHGVPRHAQVDLVVRTPGSYLVRRFFPRSLPYLNRGLTVRPREPCLTRTGLTVRPREPLPHPHRSDCQTCSTAPAAV